MKEKVVIGNSQHGFTRTNLTASCDEMTSSVDEGKAEDVVYLEFSKAFHLLGLVLAKSGSGRSGRPRRCCGDGLLHRVAVAPRRHVPGGGSRRGSVWVLLVGGGGSGRVLGIRSSGVINVRRSGSSGCCGLNVGNYHSRLHKSLWIDIVSRDPVERWERELELVGNHIKMLLTIPEYGSTSLICTL
ncbi:hypothetical protein QYF61_026677, partial [Mycteria americana]